MSPVLLLCVCPILVRSTRKGGGFLRLEVSSGAGWRKEKENLMSHEHATSLEAEPASKNKDSHAWRKGDVYHLEGSDTTGEQQSGTNKTKD